MCQIWVIAEDLTKVLKGTVKWDASFIRSVRGWNNTKKFIYRANAAPPTDAVRVGDSLLPIQSAQPVRTGSVVYKTFIGKSQKQRVVGVGVSVEGAMDAARSEDLRRRVEASDESNKRFKAS